MAPVYRQGAPQLTINTTIDPDLLQPTSADFPSGYVPSPLDPPSPALDTDAADDLYSGNSYGECITFNRRSDRICRSRTWHADLQSEFEAFEFLECEEEEEDDGNDYEEVYFDAVEDTDENDGEEFELIDIPSDSSSSNESNDTETAVREFTITVKAPGSRIPLSRTPSSPRSRPDLLTKAKPSDQIGQSQGSLGVDLPSTVASVKAQFSTSNRNPQRGQESFLRSGMTMLSSSLLLQQGDDAIELGAMPRELNPNLFKPPPAYSAQFHNED
jgi:hypothetical protein